MRCEIVIIVPLYKRINIVIYLIQKVILIRKIISYLKKFVKVELFDISRLSLKIKTYNAIRHEKSKLYG